MNNLTQQSYQQIFDLLTPETTNYYLNKHADDVWSEFACNYTSLINPQISKYDMKNHFLTNDYQNIKFPHNSNIINLFITILIYQEKTGRYNQINNKIDKILSLFIKDLGINCFLLSVLNIKQKNTYNYTPLDELYLNTFKKLCKYKKQIQPEIIHDFLLFFVSLNYKSVPAKQIINFYKKIADISWDLKPIALLNNEYLITLENNCKANQSFLNGIQNIKQKYVEKHIQTINDKLEPTTDFNKINFKKI